jgi:protein-disulfide isomerase
VRKPLIIAGVALALAVAAGIGYQQWRGSEGAGDAPEIAAAPAAGTVESEAAAAPQQLAAADQPQIRPDDRILGNADAPVTIIEYASLTCPHCAAFATETLPQVKSTYIDQGLVRLVFRDFPLDRVALKASLLARCVPDERYFAMLDVLFRSQNDWAAATDPLTALSQIGRTAGLDQASVDACLNDEAETDKIVAGIQAAQDEFKISSTPTLIINGVPHAGALTFEQMEEILKDLLPKS